MNGQLACINGRLPCINPACRRTAPAEKYEPGYEIVCGKCWRLLPSDVRKRRRTLERRSRRLLRLIGRRSAKGLPITTEQFDRIRASMERQLDDDWVRIKRYFTAAEKPIGLDRFLEEVGL